MSIDNNEILKNRVKATKKKSEGSKSKKAIQLGAASLLLAGAVIPLVAVQTAEASLPLAEVSGNLEVLNDSNVSVTNAAVGETITIKVTDINNNDSILNTTSGQDTFVVGVSSPDDARSPLNITLTEISNTGVFTGTFIIGDPGNATPAANEIRVSNTHVVTVLDPGWNSESPLNPIVKSITRKDHVTGTFRTLATDSAGPVIDKLVNQGQEFLKFFFS